MNDRWLSVDEICRHLGVGRDTVYNWIAKKDLPAHKVGRLWKFSREEVDDWILGGREDSASGSERASGTSGSPRAEIRDTGLYSSRNTSKSSLIVEAGLVIQVLRAGVGLEEARSQTLDGAILHQRSRNTRERVWDALHHRYFAHRVTWAIDAIKDAFSRGPHSPEFVSLLYFHYVLRDHLTYDIVTGEFWDKWLRGYVAVSREDILHFLDQASQEQPQIERWSQSSRDKLAGNILTALRDFGLLEGAAKKKLVKPPLPIGTAEQLLRVLTSEGIQGRDVVEHPVWRVFLCNEGDVADVLTRLSLDRRIQFERAGSTVILQTPEEWETF